MIYFGGGGMEENGGGYNIFDIYCKNFYKCHSVPPPNTTTTSKKK
jgi:hypothetical protein